MFVWSYPVVNSGAIELVTRSLRLQTHGTTAQAGIVAGPEAQGESTKCKKHDPS
jgi:hypothetical protein